MKRFLFWVFLAAGLAAAGVAGYRFFARSKETGWSPATTEEKAA